MCLKTDRASLLKHKTLSVASGHDTTRQRVSQGNIAACTSTEHTAEQHARCQHDARHHIMSFHIISSHHNISYHTASHRVSRHRTQQDTTQHSTTQHDPPASPLTSRALNILNILYILHTLTSSHPHILILMHEAKVSQHHSLDLPGK